MSAAIKTVYFDFGGVITLPQDAELKKKIWNLLSPKRTTEEEFWRTYFAFRHDYDSDSITIEEYWQRIGDAIGVEISKDMLEKLIDFDDRSWSVINPGTLDWVQAVKESGFTVGVLSNMPMRFFEKNLRPSSWIKRFEKLVISGEIGLIKPDPAIFRYAANLAGNRPEEILFFDDTLRNVEAAQAFGFRAYHFLGLDKLPEDLWSLDRLPAPNKISA